MIAIGRAHKNYILAGTLFTDGESVAAGSILYARDRLLAGMLVWAGPSSGRARCAWEDEDDTSYNPSDFYEDSCGSLDDDEDYSPYDDDYDEYDEEELDEEDEEYLDDEEELDYDEDEVEEFDEDLEEEEEFDEDLEEDEEYDYMDEEDYEDEDEEEF